MRTFTERIRSKLSRAGLLVLALGTPISLLAEPVPIISYSILDAVESGYGGWSHTFNGTITPVRDFTNGIGGPPGVVADYIDGSGTLNDGVLGGSTDNTELFVSGTPDGSTIAPVIILKLAQVASIFSIKLHEGEMDYNLFPGQITGATVEMNGVAVAVSTIPTGTINFLGVAMDDIIDLTGTPLYGARTDTIIIRDITFNPITFNQFSIAEITVDGDTSPPPSVIAIDVKPQNDKNNVSVGNGAKIRVALLSSPTFSPADVVENGLTFGRTGDEQSFLWCLSPEDLNGDGLLDDICVFSGPATGLRPGDTTAVLKGQMVMPTGTFDIIGSDHVVVTLDPGNGT